MGFSHLYMRRIKGLQFYKLFGSGVGEVGEVISDNLEVACGNNQTIKILEIQRQGKNPQKISEFMLGSRIKKGSLIPNVQISNFD